ncbi:hypothetical protein V5N11_033305 [Cardamine amara subsp. amara]|uniref:Trichohyalin-like n=1 Tax=Cardamine amara subsp. amara TaxID=228776 RepID=A0ABD0Z7P1_CARAN
MKEEKGENANVGRKSEGKSLIKLKEKEEQNSKGQKPHSKQENTKELLEEKTPVAETSIGNDILKPFQETEVAEVDTLGKTVDEVKDKKKKNGDAKEEIDAKMGEVFTPNIAETVTKTEEFESDQLKADEVDKIQKLVEKKDKDEENANAGAQSEDIAEHKFQGQKRDDKQEKIKELVEEQTPETEANIGNDIPRLVQDRCEEIKKQPEEYKEKIMETGKKISDAASERKVQEIIRQQELDEPSRCVKESKTRELVKCKTSDEEKKEKEIAETETKEQESYRPKILREQEKMEELADEKTKFSKNRKVKEKEEIAEKKTEFGDDISRKVQDIEQRDSEAMKGQEEKDMIQELVLEEKLSDEGKGIIAEAETKAENDKSKKVQEIDEQQSHEEEKCGKQFQQLIGGEISGLGEVEDVEKEKKITEAEKRNSDIPRAAQEIGEKDSDVSEEYRGIYRNEHEEEKKDEADRPEKITGMIEQELVNLNTRLEQDNVEDGEETQELQKEKIKDCKEEDSSEESKANTDDVVRKVQGTKEQDLYELKGEHVRKIKELVEEKTGDHENVEEKEIAGSQIEAECGSLKKIDCSEEQDLHEPKIHKERDKTRISGAEEPSGQEKEEDEENIFESMKITENENSTNVKDFEEERPDKPESNEKRYKIQEVVEAGHNGRKEDQQEEKVHAKAELETEKESSKKVQETEQQEYDRVKRSMVQDKMAETEENRATEEKAIMERRTKTKDDSLKSIRDDEDQELSKPYKRQEDKIQELAEMGTSDYREKVKKQDEDDDILRSQEAGRPDLGEPSNIPQLVGEEKMEERENRKDLVNEEVTGPKDKDTVEEGHNDHKEKQQDKKVIAKAELKTEEESSKKVQEIGKHEFDGLKRSLVQNKMQETEEKGKNRAMDEKNIVERKKKTKDGNLRKVRGDQDPELSKPYKIPDLDEVERHGEQCNIPQLVGEEKVENNAELGGKMEDDSSGKFHEFEEGKSYEYWTYEQREKRKDLVKEEATDLKDRHTGGKGHDDHKEEQQEENIIAKADFEKQELKSEEHSLKKFREIEKEEYDGLKRSMVEDKMRETEETDKTRAMEENEIVASREKTKDGSLRKVREGDNPELGRHKRHGEEDMIQKLVERELSDHREKVKKKDEEDISRSQETGKLDLGELERHCKQRKIHQSVEDEKGEGKMENIPELGEKMKGDSSGKVHEFRKQKSYEDWIEEESEEIENLVKEEEPGPKDKLTGGEGEHEEERYEKVAETITKVEDEINTNAGEDKEPESDKKERYGKLDENLVDDFTTKIQETEKEDSHELEMHEKLDIVPDFVEDETGDQEDEEAEEAAALMASNENGSSRKVQKIEEKTEKHTEQNKISETSGPEMQEEDEERVAEKKTEELTAHVQELEGETENIKDDNGEEKREEKGKQGKTVETMSGERFKKKNRKSMEEKSTAPEVEKEGNEKIAEDEIGSRIEDQEIKRQEPYELLRSGEHDKIPQCHREEEKVEIEEIKRTAEDVSSRKVQQIKAQEPDGLEKYQKLREIQEKRNIQESVEEETREHGEEEMNEGGGYKAVLQPKSIASSQSQDVEEKESNQPKRYAEQAKIQEVLMTEEEGKEEYHIREGEQNEKAKIVPQVESKANDDSSVKNETERHESTGLRGEKDIENHQELMEIETSDQRKSETEEEVAEKAETINEYDSSRKIHEHEERKSDKMSENFAAEETQQGEVLEEVETKIGKVKETEEQEEDKKQSFVEKDTSGKAKENKNQETKRRDDSSRKKTQENENQESHEQKRNEEQDKKKLELVEKKTNYCRSEEDANEDKEIPEAEVPRKLKQIEKQESTKIVKRHENQELVEEEMNNQEGENKNSIKDEETAMTETKSKDNESRKIHQTVEQETSEQGRINEFVEDRTHCRDKENLEKTFEDDSSKSG